MRGLALARIGDYDAALASLQSAADRFDEKVENHLALAHFFLERGDINAAMDSAAQAVKKRPGYHHCTLTYAVVLWERGQRKEALARIAPALRWGRPKIPADDLEYDHFWGPRALTALQAMLEAVPKPQSSEL